MQNIPNIPLLLGVIVPPVVDRITEFPTLGIIPVATIGGSFYLYRNGYGVFTIPVVLLGTGLTYTEFLRSETTKELQLNNLTNFYRRFFTKLFHKEEVLEPSFLLQEYLDSHPQYKS